MNLDTPLACDMGVLTPAEGESHLQITTELIQAVQRVQEVENGYQFTFPNENVFISKIAEFISNERLCCPFLKISLNVLSNSEPVSLLLTGPLGTPEFLRAEFSEAFL